MDGEFSSHATPFNVQLDVLTSSFLEFLELNLHHPGIVASQVVTLNPVIAAPFLARERFFGFRFDFGFFGASLGSRFGLLDLLEPCSRADGGGSCGSCSREFVAVVGVDEVSRG